jgi:tRNA nucleotidyltransferase (CCA-adding enzyme)
MTPGQNSSKKALSAKLDYNHAFGTQGEFRLNTRSQVQLPFEIPKKVEEICAAIARAGEKSYVVGGATRDMLLGRPVEDFDLATTATPDRVMEIFPRVIPTGVKHGTVTVLAGGEGFEVTTLRGEGAYSDCRRPDSIEFLKDIEGDLARRDFTVNAIAWDPIGGVLHDPFGGWDDLKRSILRAVGSPQDRFEEDGLRVLRAARFAATLEFQVEEKTLRAMPKAGFALSKVSVERKRDELKKILMAKKPSIGLDLVERTGLMGFISTDIQDLIDDDSSGVWPRTLARVDALTQETLPLKVAALVADLDIGTDDIDDNGLFQMITGWLKEMKFDRKTIERVPLLVRENRLLRYDVNWSDGEIRRFMSRQGIGIMPDLLKFQGVYLGTKPGCEKELKELGQLIEKTEKFLADEVPLTIGDLDLDGNTLLTELNLDPGPFVGAVLGKLLDRVLEHPEDNCRSRLLQLAKQMASNG